jgi:hypothetical protein
MADNTDEARRAIVSAYNRMYAAKNRERIAAKARERYQQNREAILEANRSKVDAWHKDNPEAIREHKRRYREKNREKLREADRKYIRDENGEITAKEKAHQARNRIQRALDLEGLAGRPRPLVCDICEGPPDPKRGMHFDHCHQSGQFRGWLCRKCNLMLGNAEDDPSRLRKGAAYLERSCEVIHSKTLTGSNQKS